MEEIARITQEVLEELQQSSRLDALPEVLAGGPVEPQHGFVLFERGDEPAEDEALFITDSIEHNVELPPNRFEPPPEVLAQLGASASAGGAGAVSRAGCRGGKQ